MSGGSRGFKTKAAGWALCALAAGWALAPAARADLEGRKALETARAAKAEPAALLPLLEALIADEAEGAEQREAWRAERAGLVAAMTRARATDLLREAPVGEATAEVIARMKAVLADLREVARGTAADDAKDREIIRRLERQVLWAEVRPVVDALEKTLAAAREAKGDEAEALFRKARDMQADLNARYPDSPSASAMRLRRLDDELAGIARARGEAELVRILAEARASAESEAAREALLAAAEKLRADLDAKLPGSEASANRAALERGMQAVRATPYLSRAARLDAEAAALLRAGDAPAASAKLEAAMAEIAEATKAFPAGATPDAELGERLPFLWARRARLGDLQREFSGLLLPLPGVPGVWMMGVEMPQGLHERLMGSNPSRFPGVKRPVESVNLEDARAVAKRLGWILGAEVRLPTFAEWGAALANSEQQGWLAENSDGQVREVGRLAANAAGFHDLIGNVAEWLLPDPAETRPITRVAGGDALASRDAVAKSPAREAEPARRDRLIGYRLVLVKQ